MAKTIAALQVALDLESANFVKASDEAKRKARDLGDSLEASGARAEQASQGVQQLANSKAQLGNVARNAGYQIQDFAVQVGSGTSATQALTQQLPQMLSAFGTVGVVLGTVAAISIPLLSAGLQALVGNIKTTEEASKEVAEAAKLFTSANDVASQSLAQLAGVYNAQAGPALKQLYDQLLAIAQVNLGDKMRDFTNALIGNFASIGRLAMPEFLRIFMDTPEEKLGKQFGITADEAEKLLATLRGFQRQNIPFETLRDHVLALQLQTRQATEEGRTNIQQLLRTLTEFEEARSRLTPPQKAAQEEAKKAADAAKAFVEDIKKQALALRGVADSGLSGAEAVLLLNASKHGYEAMNAAEGLILLQRQINQEKLVEKQLVQDVLQQLEQQRQETEALAKAEYSRQIQAKRFEQQRMADIADRLDAARTPLQVLDADLEQIQRDFLAMRITFEEAELLSAKAVDNLSKSIRKTKEPLDDLMRMVDRTGERFTDAFVQMALTGKVQMGNMVNSIIADLMRMTVRATITEPLFAFIKTALPIPGKAIGGPVEAGQPYLVGERGPELFVPKFAGTIVANDKLGEGTTVINYNINAIDTKSFEDRLLQSNKAIWAAHSYASKSLAPQGRV